MTISVISLQQKNIQVLQDYLEFIDNDPDTEACLALDKENHHYLLIETGWQNNRRFYGTPIHIDIINEKIWIHP